MNERRRCWALCWRTGSLAGLVLVISSLFASAQPLPDEAQAVLLEGQRLAALAMTRYADHFPDQPLWREAIDHGRRAQRLAPERPEPYRFLGQVYSITGWYSRAWQTWQSYLELGGELDAPARSQLLAAATWLGFNSFSAGNYDASVTYLEEAYELNPDDRLTLMRLAQAHLELGRPEAAEPYARRLAELEPVPGDAQELVALVDDYLRYGVEAVDAWRQGESELAAGRTSEALAAFRKASELNPDFEPALERAGRLAMELGRFEESAGYFERLAALRPDDPQVGAALTEARQLALWGSEAYSAYREGESAFEQGDLAVASEWLQRAVRLAPDMAQAHAMLGRVHFQQGDFGTAEDHFRDAVRLAPTESSYRFFLSAAEEQRLEQEEALARRPQEPRQEQPQPAGPPVAEAVPPVMAEREQEVGDEALDVATPEDTPGPAGLDGAVAGRAEPEPRPQAQGAAEEPAAAEPPATEPAAAEPAAAEPAAAEPPAAEPAAAGPPAQAAAEPAEPDGPPTSSATPLVVADTVVVHSSPDEGGSGAFSFLPAQELERDLRTPVDYSTATLYQRLEVMAKPSDAPVHYQVCLVPNDDIAVQPACSSSGMLRFTEPGVYQAEQPLSALSGYQDIDWSKGLESLILVIKDPSGLPVDNRYLAGITDRVPDPTQYYPMEVRYTAVLVPVGGQFSGWPR